METVFLTGGAGLLGRQFVAAFLERGNRVIYTSHSTDKIQAMERTYPSQVQDGQLVSFPLDLLAEDMERQVMSFLVQHDLHPAYLVNNARSLAFVKIEDYRKITEEQWLGEFRLDVVVPYKLMMLLSGMKPSALKSVANISSMYGLLAYNEYLCEGAPSISSNYGVAKAALIQLTREMAARLAGKGIRVNCISYGCVAGRAYEAFQKRYANLCPARKMLAPEDVAAPLLHLCSPQSSGMTGQNLVVDGGFSIW